MGRFPDWSWHKLCTSAICRQLITPQNLYEALSGCTCRRLHSLNLKMGAMEERPHNRSWIPHGGEGRSWIPHGGEGREPKQAHLPEAPAGLRLVVRMGAGGRRRGQAGRLAGRQSRRRPVCRGVQWRLRLQARKHEALSGGTTACGRHIRKHECPIPIEGEGARELHRVW